MQKHKAAIVTLMLQRLQRYCEYYVVDAGCNATAYNDVKYNMDAVNAFIRDSDVYALHTAVVRQDTLVREHFYAVLKYIEDNNLIAANEFVCS